MKLTIPSYNQSEKRIDRFIVLGGSGLVGSAFVRHLKRSGHHVYAPSRADLDLTNRDAVDDYLYRHLVSPGSFYGETGKVHMVIAAAKCGGIYDNKENQYAYMMENIRIQDNIFDSLKSYLRTLWPKADDMVSSTFMSKKYDVGNIMFLGSSCIYPAAAPQPFKEESLGTGKFEPTNEGYAMAKMVGIKQANELRKMSGGRLSIFTVNPCNVYGPYDNFSSTGHVVGAIIDRLHKTKENNQSRFQLTNPQVKREFIYSEDLARICVDLLKIDDFASKLPEGHINVGPGQDVTLAELVDHLINIIGYRGKIEHVFEHSIEGMPAKLLDVSLMKQFTSVPTLSLYEGLKKTYAWYQVKKDMMEI